MGCEHDRNVGSTVRVELGPDCRHASGRSDRHCCISHVRCPPECILKADHSPEIKRSKLGCCTGCSPGGHPIGPADRSDGAARRGRAGIGNGTHRARGAGGGARRWSRWGQCSAHDCAAKKRRAGAARGADPHPDHQCNPDIDALASRSDLSSHVKCTGGSCWRLQQLSRL